MIEEQLITSSKQGDSKAFGQLYDLYVQKLFAFVITKVRHRPTAEDILQDVFVKAWQGLPRFQQEDSNFNAWMYKIASNCVNDHFRKEKRRPENLPLEDYASSIKDDQPTQAEELDLHLEQDMMKKAMAELPPTYRQVLLLRFKSGLSAKEVASILNKTSVAVRLIQHRAMKQLRIIIKSGYDKILQK